MGRLSQFRTLQVEFPIKRKTKPIVANRLNQLGFIGIRQNRPGRSELSYVTYYQRLAAILPPIFAKLLLITVGWPDSDELHLTKPTKPNDVKVHCINITGEICQEQTHCTYQAYYHAVTSILPLFFEKRVPNPPITIADSHSSSSFGPMANNPSLVSAGGTG